MRHATAFLRARSALIGTIMALAGVLGPICLSGNDLSAFCSAGGLVLVFGGVVSVAFMSFDAPDVRRALAAIASIPEQPEPRREALRRETDRLVRWSHILREGDLRRLEAEAGRTGLQDPLLRYGLNMVLGEHAATDIRAMMTTACERAHERECLPADVLHAMASHAPAFGMVGTLVGMVATLSRIDTDPSSIGSMLALSFLSTLYGLLSARLLYMPAAARLQGEADRRRALDDLITDGVVMLAERRTPSATSDRLNSHLDPDARDYLDTIAHDPNTRAALRPTTATRQPLARAGLLVAHA